MDSHSFRNFVEGEVRGQIDQGELNGFEPFELFVLDRAQCHLGNEIQCSFGTNHEAHDYINGVVGSDEDVDAVSCGVFDGEFVSDFFAHGLIYLDTFGEKLDFIHNILGCGLEYFPAGRVHGVENRAVVKEHPQA